MKVCVSIPHIPPEKAGEFVESLKGEFEGIAEVKAVCSTKYSCPDSVVVRVIADSNDFNENIEKFKALKEKYPNATVRVECYQSGGGLSNTGSATVTALADGSRPERIAGGHYSNGTHAKYWINEGFIIDCDYWNKDNYPWHGEIDWVEVSFDGFKMYKVGTFRATSRDDIEIEPEKPELFRNLDKLLPAVQTAMRKAVCYHCREEHVW